MCMMCMLFLGPYCPHPAKSESQVLDKTKENVYPSSHQMITACGETPSITLPLSSQPLCARANACVSYCFCCFHCVSCSSLASYNHYMIHCLLSTFWKPFSLWERASRPGKGIAFPSAPRSTGFAMHAAPVYIAEIAPAEVRGTLVSAKELRFQYLRAVPTSGSIVYTQKAGA